jgi:hypothetical protein
LAGVYLSQKIASVLETLTFEHNFAWPVYVVVIASNGSMLCLHYRVPGENAQVVAQHSERYGFAVPINLVLVSSGDGRAAKLLISKPDGDPEVHDE